MTTKYEKWLSDFTFTYCLTGDFPKFKYISDVIYYSDEILTQIYCEKMRF